MIICCTPLTAIRPAATGWTGPSPTCAAESSAASAGEIPTASPTGWPLSRPSAEGDGSAGGGGSPGEIAAQRGAADARLYRQRRFGFPGWCKNTVRFGRHKAARRVYSAQTIERTAHVITLPAPSGAAAPWPPSPAPPVAPHRPDADPAELSGGCAERAHCDVLAGSARQSLGFPAFAAGGYRWRRPSADGDERRHLR